MTGPADGFEHPEPPFMQGYTHALSGAAAWLALTSSSSAALGWSAFAPSVVLAGGVLCAGAALLPDLDHPDATIAWSLPPVAVGALTLVPSPTRALCAGVGAISGGHRHGTHSLLGIAAFTALAWAASLVTVTAAGRPVALGSGVLAVLLVAFAVKALGIARAVSTGRRRGLAPVLRSWLGPWVLALGAAGYATWALAYQWTWLPLAVGVGALAHVLGDTLTVGGVPWAWPANPAPPRRLTRVPVVGSVVRRVWQPNGYVRVPLLGRTSSLRESALAAFLGLYVLWLVIVEVGRLSAPPLP